MEVSQFHYNKYKLSQKLGLRLAHNNCDFENSIPEQWYIYIYIFTISQFTVTAQSEQELYIWTEHADNGPATFERVL